jgi:predicted esterase
MEQDCITLFETIQKIRQLYYSNNNPKAQKELDEVLKQELLSIAEKLANPTQKPNAEIYRNDIFATLFYPILEEHEYMISQIIKEQQKDYEDLINEIFKLNPSDSYKKIDFKPKKKNAIITIILKPLQMLLDMIIVHISFPSFGVEKTQSTLLKQASEEVKQKYKKAQESIYATSDGYKYKIIKNPRATETVVLFHGNGEIINPTLYKDKDGNVCLWDDNHIYGCPNKNIIIMEYPSYCKVPGRPTKENLDKMMEKCWADIKSQHLELVQNKVIVAGLSVGGYCAVKFAKDYAQDFKGLMLLNTYSSTLDILPTWLSSIFKYITTESLSVEEQLQDMPNKEMPIIICEAENDRLFDKSHAQKNLNAIKSKLHNAEIITSPGGHCEVHWDKIMTKITEKIAISQNIVKRFKDLIPDIDRLSANISAKNLP